MIAIAKRSRRCIANPEVMADYRGPSTDQRAVRNSSDTLPLIAFLDGPLKIWTAHS
jgi:hypothetical protein